MNTERTIPQRLDDIQDAISCIRKYTRETQDIHDYDELVQIWIVHHFYVLGEAVRAIAEEYPAFKNQHPEIKWKDIIRMRTLLAHRYFQISLNALWKAIQEDLLDLKRSIDAIQEKGVA
jgi:uncharacterized protein with HEPN domain